MLSDPVGAGNSVVVSDQGFRGRSYACGCLINDSGGRCVVCVALERSAAAGSSDELPPWRTSVARSVLGGLWRSLFEGPVGTVGVVMVDVFDH